MRGFIHYLRVFKASLPDDRRCPSSQVCCDAADYVAPKYFKDASTGRHTTQGTHDEKRAPHACPLTPARDYPVNHLGYGNPLKRLSDFCDLPKWRLKIVRGITTVPPAKRLRNNGKWRVAKLAAG